MRLACLLCVLLVSCVLSGRCQNAQDSISDGAQIRQTYFSNIVQNPSFPILYKLEALDSLIQDAVVQRSSRNKIQEVNSLLNKKADLLEKTGNYAAALQTSLRQLGILDSLPMETVDGNEKWELFYRIARMHFYTGDYESCLLFLYQVLEGCKDTDLNIRAHAFLSKTFINLHQFPLATKHIRSAEALIDSLPRRIDTSTLFTYSNQKAALYPKSVTRNRVRTEAGKMPESLIFPIGSGHGVSDDRFGFITRPGSTRPVSTKWRRPENTRRLRGTLLSSPRTTKTWPSFTSTWEKPDWPRNCF